MTVTVQDLARACGLDVVGGDPAAVIHSAARLDAAGPNQLSFITHERDVARIHASTAGAMIVPKAATIPGGASVACLPSADPEIDFIRCLNLLYPPRLRAAGINPQAHVDPSAQIGADTFIDAGVTVAADARIGRGCQLYAGCYVGDHVEVGDGCTLYPNVVLYPGTVLRDNVIIHAGSVIGADGFGYKHRKGVHIKFPQVGTVLIERDVEIGANTCIDRAALGQTVVGAGSKIDNLVQVAHGVAVGKGALIAGQAGIGGSSIIEDYAILAAQAGISDHVRIGRGATVFAQAGVIGDVEAKAGVVGFPAADRKHALREMATVRRLVELYKPLKALVDLLPMLKERTKSER